MTDSEILANPYLCFEADRGRQDAISVRTVDRGLFPTPAVAASAPVPEPSACGEAIDSRRARAFMIEALDTAAAEGHTLLPQTWLVQRVRDLDVTPQCAIGADWIEAFSSILAERLVRDRMADESPAWQLREYADARELIATRIKRRLSGRARCSPPAWRFGIISARASAISGDGRCRAGAPRFGPAPLPAMLAIQAHRTEAHISVGELADLLLIRHNTAAELVKRLEKAGLVRKWYDPADRRRALLALSADGQAKLGEIATAQLQRLHESRAALMAIFGLPTPGDGRS